MARHIVLHIDCDNAAFGDTPETMRIECDKIITDMLARWQHSHASSFKLTDENGNAVGFAVINDGAHDVQVG